ADADRRPARVEVAERARRGADGHVRALAAELARVPVPHRAAVAADVPPHRGGGRADGLRAPGSLVSRSVAYACVGAAPLAPPHGSPSAPAASRPPAPARPAPLAGAPAAAPSRLSFGGRSDAHAPRRAASASAAARRIRRSPSTRRLARRARHRTRRAGATAP